MLGYKKEESIFLPQDHLRKIFNLAGIVMPPILIDGKVMGRWRLKDKTLSLEVFSDLAKNQDIALHYEAERFFGGINILKSNI